MGECCSKASEEVEKEKKDGFKEGDIDIHEGPVKDRGCTDVFCIPFFIVGQIAFIAVTMLGMQDGAPDKLYKPRDFQGAYCGVESNWNDGPITEGMPMAAYSMNLSSIVDEIMKQTVCSTAVRDIMTTGSSPLLVGEAKQEAFLCDCCMIPCAKCNGQVSFGGDLPNPASLATTIADKMSELTGKANPDELFNPSLSANGASFSGNDFWGEATKYFNQVCLPDCSTNFGTMNSSSGTTRTYRYAPAMDDPLYKEWMLLLNANANSGSGLGQISMLIATAFEFEALPFDVCPYPEAYCVPMVGVEFEELTAGSNRCSFKMAAEVVASIGEAAASAFTGLGGDAISSAATTGFGDMVGDFERTVDAFAIVCGLSFVVGIVFLVLLRFFIGVCVWVAVALTGLMFLAGGGFAFVRSFQCQGTSFWDTTHQTAVAVTVAAKTLAENTINQEEAISEAMDPAGDGADYRGVQAHTRFGKACVNWDNHPGRLDKYTAANYNESGLIQNFCRNPYDSGDLNKASTIFCITNDAEEMWEICSPIGVIQPPCTNGYSISSTSMRDMLWYASFVVWGLGALFVLIILCFRSRIQLAISLNKVGARFLASNPTVLIVPIIQALVALMWISAWCYSVTFLVSQVPDDYTPQGYFATYQEAYGTSSTCAFWEFGDECGSTPGACNSQWPVGEVWKDDNCSADENGTAMCYRCFPPRYILDWRFAVSFFMFLWNNAFNVALGQIVIAMCTCIWFFRGPDERSNWFKPTGLVPRSIGTVFRYHLGSVAFGSFIVAVVQFIRYLMKYFEKQAGAQGNRVMVLILKILQCCIWCFEKCVQFLNKNAYIQIALLGKPFCTSAKKAFWLIMRNALRFATVAVLSWGIHAIGYLMIISGSMVCGYYVVRELHPDLSPVMPLISYYFVSYVVAKLYLNVFGLAVDSALQCFIACEEMNISGDFIPKDLKNFVDKNCSAETKDSSASI